MNLGKTEFSENGDSPVFCNGIFPGKAITKGKKHENTLE